MKFYCTGFIVEMLLSVINFHHFGWRRFTGPFHTFELQLNIICVLGGGNCQIGCSYGILACLNMIGSLGTNGFGMVSTQ
jgi:hypothetical protein